MKSRPNLGCCVPLCGFLAVIQLIRLQQLLAWYLFVVSYEDELLSFHVLV
jgi:hypothetical protein